VNTPSMDLTLKVAHQDGLVLEGFADKGLTYPSADALRLRGPRMHGTPVERLARSYIVEASGCWRWIKGRTTSGYGHFWFEGTYYQAHLIVYIVKIGPLPVGLEPDHLCRNRWCVNPADIEFVTHAVNMQRGTRTRLTPGEVEMIRAEVAAGMSQRAIARARGIDHSTVSRLVRGLIWPEAKCPAHAAETAA
jgi:hypothetical protein